MGSAYFWQKALRQQQRMSCRSHRVSLSCHKGNQRGQVTRLAPQQQFALAAESILLSYASLITGRIVCCTRYSPIRHDFGHRNAELSTWVWVEPDITHDSIRLFRLDRGSKQDATGRTLSKNIVGRGQRNTRVIARGQCRRHRQLDGVALALGIHSCPGPTFYREHTKQQDADASLADAHKLREDLESR